jgi:hypothetical protein
MAQIIYGQQPLSGADSRWAAHLLWRNRAMGIRSTMAH